MQDFNLPYLNNIYVSVSIELPILTGFPIFYHGGGSPTEVHISYSVYLKNPNFRTRLPKKIPTLLAYPKNPPPAVNCTYVIIELSLRKVQYPKKSGVFCATQKIPASFTDPKKPLIQGCPCNSVFIILKYLSLQLVDQPLSLLGSVVKR